MYADTNSVDLQEYFDKNLAPASRTIFLNTVLCRWSLTEKYILSTPHLNTWNTAQRVLWPIIYVFLRRTYGINEAAVQDAWKTVDACFDKVDEILKTQGRNHYLIGDSLSAADISFASHAALVLFPNQDDVWADRLTLKTPKLSEIPEELASKIKKLRASAAGSFAIRMYKKERGTSLRQQASKHHSKNNPFWAKSETFRKVAVTVIPALILAVVAIFFTVSFKVQGIILCCILVFSAQLANNWYGPTRVIRLFKELYRLFSIYKTQLKSEESPGMKKGQ